MNSIGLLLAEALPAQPTPEQVLIFLVAGVVVVILALGLLATCMSVVAIALRLFSRDAVLAQRNSAPSDEISEELAVVIAAAVATVVAEPHHIVRIQERRSGEPIWTLEGRMMHHASHELRHRERP